MNRSEFLLHAKLEDHHWWFVARRKILLGLLRRHLPADPGRLIVEIGCGTGGNLKYLKDHYRVMGVDLSPEAVAAARQRVGCPILTGDFSRQLAPFWPEIEAVLLPDVLEHIDADRDFLQRIIIAMPPGAILLLTVPAHPFLWSHHDKVLGHLRRYSRRELKSLWDGLPVQEAFFSPFNSLLFPLIAAYRLLRCGAQDGEGSDLKPIFSFANRLLSLLFAAERFWLRCLPLPFGCSYCVILKKSGA